MCHLTSGDIAGLMIVGGFIAFFLLPVVAECIALIIAAWRGRA